MVAGFYNLENEIRTCICGCGNSFVVTQKHRTHFNKLCQKRTKQRRYIRKDEKKEIRKASALRYSTKNKEKIRNRACQRRMNNPEKERQRYNGSAGRSSYLKRTYGISLEEYTKMLDEQHNSCAICNISYQDHGRQLSVDHDHATGIIRGLLCRNCNVGIGNLRESIEVLEKAIIYLKKGNKS